MESFEPLDRLDAQMRDVVAQIARLRQVNPIPEFQEKAGTVLEELAQARSQFSDDSKIKEMEQRKQQLEASMKTATAEVNQKVEAAQKKMQTIQDLKAKHGSKWVFHYGRASEPPEPDLTGSQIKDLVQGLLVALGLKEVHKPLKPLEEESVWEMKSEAWGRSSGEPASPPPARPAAETTAPAAQPATKTSPPPDSSEKPTKKPTKKPKDPNKELWEEGLSEFLDKDE